MDVEVHPQARAEALEVRAWYQKRDPILAEAFVDEMESALAHVAERPKAWPPFESGTRRYLRQRFPYSIVYRICGSTLEVVAIAHASRRPGYWVGR